MSDLGNTLANQCLAWWLLALPVVLVLAFALVGARPNRARPEASAA